jgi:hypothetical protein
MRLTYFGALSKKLILKLQMSQSRINGLYFIIIIIKGIADIMGYAA